MDTHQYKRLMKRLNSMDDVKRIAQQSKDLDEELLFVIYTQKVTRDATKHYYRVKHHIEKKHLKAWKSGKPLIKIAKEEDFPPTLIAFLLLRAKGVPRKEFWSMARNPEIIKNKRIKKEMEEVLKNDNIYSPEGSELQRIRGKVGESRLEKWLDSHGISYQTEEDLRGKQAKTPDALLDKPVLINGWKTHWIESKAIFGDKVEIKRHIKKQLVPYTDLFGPGIVVYWFGYVNDYKLPKDIRFLDAEHLEGAKVEPINQTRKRITGIRGT